MKKVLLVEDEVSVVSFIRKGLSEEGYEVSVALDGNSALQMARSSNFDIIILDLMLPGLNGLQVCRSIRETNKKIAILILTALGTTENVVAGFESEADDYLTKPFKFVELLARMRSLLRRTDGPVPAEQKAHEETYIFADVVVNDYTKIVTRAGKQISLTSTEYKLLLLLIRNPRRVFSRMEILEQVWSVNFDLSTNVVDVYINYLRKKIDKDHDPKLIHTVIGMGYVLKEGDEKAK
jgi:DNA-binding response OmpR family regulator